MRESRLNSSFLRDDLHPFDHFHDAQEDRTRYKSMVKDSLGHTLTG